jgi:uncharacterized protein
MTPTSVVIAAQDTEAARREGARKLCVQPDQVTVRPSGESAYTVALKSAPGGFEITVSEDKMSAAIEITGPPKDPDEPVTAAEVEKAVAEKGLSFGMDPEAIRKVVKDAAGGKAQESVVVAAGRPPVPGCDASIEFGSGERVVDERSLSRYSVKPGQVVAAKTPAAEGTEGMNVLGEAVPCEVTQDRELFAGENISVSENGATFVSDVYGLAEVAGNTISVEPCVEVSADGLSARMTLRPTLSDNSCLSVDDVLAALRQAGVVNGVKEPEIAAALESEKSPRKLKVAEVAPSEDGVDAHIAFQFNLNGNDPEAVDDQRQVGELDETAVAKELVSGGAALAVKTPLTPRVKGFSVTGEALPCREPRDKKLSAGANVVLRDDELTYAVADGATGYANLINGSLCVENPIRVAENGLAVYLSVHPPSSSGVMLDAAGVTRLLEEHGIQYGINSAAIAESLNSAKAGGEPVHDTPIAKGRPPLKGQDARIELKFQTAQSAGTVVEGTDRVDYRERGTLQNVRPGSLLAVKTPATPGQDGADVFGSAIPATPGEDKELDIAENVTISEDGLQYMAETEGVVSLVGEDKIGVFQYYEVPGDVDYSTGNLTMDGTLNVKGWVRSGFSIRARGDLCVGAGMEDAVIEAGGNVEVCGGIVGKETASVSAHGAIRAYFVENARLAAGTDIAIRDSVMHSALSAQGHVNVTEGKGRIVGGTVTARKGIEVNELGSEATTKTALCVGMDTESLKKMAALEKEVRFYRRNKKKIALSLALLSNKAKLRTLSGAGAGQMAKLAKSRREAALKETRLTNYKKALAKTLGGEGKPVDIRVGRQVFEGTVVTIMGRHLRVREDYNKGGRFVLDTNEWAVRFVDNPGEKEC